MRWRRRARHAGLAYLGAAAPVDLDPSPALDRRGAGGGRGRRAGRRSRHGRGAAHCRPASIVSPPGSRPCQGRASQLVPPSLLLRGADACRRRHAALNRGVRRDPRAPGGLPPLRRRVPAERPGPGAGRPAAGHGRGGVADAAGRHRPARDAGRGGPARDAGGDRHRPCPAPARERRLALLRPARPTRAQELARALCRPDPEMAGLSLHRQRRRHPPGHGASRVQRLALGRRRRRSRT